MYFYFLKIRQQDQSRALREITLQEEKNNHVKLHHSNIHTASTKHQRQSSEIKS